MDRGTKSSPNAQLEAMQREVDEDSNGKEHETDVSAFAVYLLASNTRLSKQHGSVPIPNPTGFGLAWLTGSATVFSDTSDTARAYLEGCVFAAWVNCPLASVAKCRVPRICVRRWRGVGHGARTQPHWTGIRQVCRAHISDSRVFLVDVGRRSGAILEQALLTNRITQLDCLVMTFSPDVGRLHPNFRFPNKSLRNRSIPTPFTSLIVHLAMTVTH